MNNEINNKKKDKIIIMTVVFAVIIIALLFMVVFFSKKSTNDKNEETTTVEITKVQNMYSGTVLSANNNWIGVYSVGDISECVYNNDGSGIYENNTDYVCSDGTSCCTGDMSKEYSFGSGSAMGGGLSETGVEE